MSLQGELELRDVNKNYVLVYYGTYIVGLFNLNRKFNLRAISRNNIAGGHFCLKRVEIYHLPFFSIACDINFKSNFFVLFFFNLIKKIIKIISYSSSLLIDPKIWVSELNLIIPPFWQRELYITNILIFHIITERKVV